MVIGICYELILSLYRFQQRSAGTRTLKNLALAFVSWAACSRVHVIQRVVDLGIGNQKRCRRRPVVRPCAGWGSIAGIDRARSNPWSFSIWGTWLPASPGIRNAAACGKGDLGHISLVCLIFKLPFASVG